ESKHLMLLPAVTEAGMIAGTVYKVAVERVHIEIFLKRHLLPVMNCFPGCHSVLVLDNAKVHHGTYLPDINPIKKGFHCIKHALKCEQPWQVVDLADYLLHIVG
ncbi:hypothetical protein CROQUDRAFT_36901, partial [Cronartium quercuum f. sp. fusiforme G11]